MKNYSVTLNFPEEYQDSLQQTATKFEDILKKRKLPYIMAIEECKSGKQHVHIGYQSSIQRTDNESRMFKNCYPFSKQTHPHAIDHKQHHHFSILVQYVSKDGNIIGTNMTDEIITKHKGIALKQLETLPKKKNLSLTIEDVATGFCNYYQNYIENNKTTEDQDYRIVRLYMQTIKRQLPFKLYTRIHQEKLIEYAKIQYEPSNKFI